MINSNLHSVCGTGVVNHATAFPAAETSLLLITMDPADFAPGVVFIYNSFGGTEEGNVLQKYPILLLIFYPLSENDGVWLIR